MFLSPQSARCDPEDVVYPGRTLLPGEIRLIRLLPGEWTDPVRCKLFEDVLGTTKYEALSYVWGSKNVTRPILLNQRKFPVTFNLESALRHLRERAGRELNGAILWVDALCIDQRNESERTSQVQMMGNIYGQCSQTIVYLGDQIEDSSRHDRSPAPTIDYPRKAVSHVRYERTETAVSAIFSMFEGLANSKTQHLKDVLPNENLAGWQASDHKHMSELVFYENLRKMMHPPFTPWWSRIWVVQEVTVPPEVLVVYGTASVSWAVLASAARTYTSHSLKCCSQFVMTAPRDAKVLDDCFNRILAIDSLRKGHYMSVPGQMSANPSRDGQKWPLLGLLRKFRDRKATDPRDKVYALLSIAQMSTPMIPDYSWTDVMVFRRATIECIYEEKSLSVLSTDLGRKFRGDLPSWVPDWGAPGGMIYEARAAVIELYNASPRDRAADHTTVYEVELVDGNYLPYQLSLSRVPSGLALQMQGSKLATIFRVDDVMWGGDVARIWQSTLMSWYHAYEKWHKKRRQEKIFWRLICGDVVCESEQGTTFRRTVPGDELAFMMWMEVSERSPKTTVGRYWVSRDGRSAGPPYEYWSDEYWSDEAKVWRVIQSLWQDKVSWGAPDPSTERYVIGKIKTHGDFSPPGSNASNTSRISEFRELECFAINSGWHVDEPMLETSGEIRREYPWEALLSHVTARLLQKYGPHFDLNVQTQLAHVPAVDKAIMTATLSRRLIASDEYIGLGPANTQVGDELYILSGGKTPFVLRAKGAKTGESENEPRFEIIGDAYVQGRMDFSEECTEDDGPWHSIYLH